MPVKMYIPIDTKLFVTITVLGSVIFILIRRSLVCHRFARDYGCRPVAGCLSKDPFLGLDTIPKSLHARKQHKMLERSCEYFTVYGNTFTVKELQKSAIVTIEPENIKTILSLNFGHYGIKHRLEAFRPLLGEGIFDTDGDHWTASRSLIRPSFTRNQMADFATLEDLIQDLFVLLPRDGKTVVDLQDLFFCYTMDSATEFLFGQSVGTLKQNKQVPDFAEAFCYAQRNIVVRATLGPLKALYRDAKADECHRICRGFAQPFVDEAFRANATKKAIQGQHPKTARGKRIFSHELASRTADRHRVLNESMNVLLAGRDTTASLLSNLFFMLAKNPAIWAKLRREVACLQGRPPTYEQLKSLKYVEYCIRESLCLHPVVPRNEREALKDTVLPVGGGKYGLSPVFVPKGTIVAYNLYAMHRRMDFYGPDAEKFRPERWENDKLRPRWGYLPFNGGPRICVGQRYALTEAGYVVVRMAQEFQILLSQDAGPWEESLTLTLSSRNGTKVCLTPA